MMKGRSRSLPLAIAALALAVPRARRSADDGFQDPAHRGRQARLQRGVDERGCRAARRPGRRAAALHERARTCRAPSRFPYQPWAEAERQKYLERRGIDDPIGRCMMPGVPRTTGMPMPIQFVQAPKQFIILYEAYHAYRVIPFDAEHPYDVEPSFMGDSVAHWDGDTLVVDVVGFNTQTWISGVGIGPHRSAARGRALPFRRSADRGDGSDDRRSRSADQAVETVLHAAAGAGRADSRIRVPRKQRGPAPVRTDPQDRSALQQK